MKKLGGNATEVLLFALLVSVLTACQTPYRPGPEIEASIPQRALNYALGKVDSPYVWGGQGPYEFDCSGIIICAYAEALQTSYFLVNMEDVLCNDVTMDVLYKKNVTTVKNEDVQPGDIVFITNDETKITHGGLFIRWIDENTIGFINASSYYGKVLVDTWPVSGTKRDQWIAGFGKLKLR